MSPEKAQYKVKLSTDVEKALHEQAMELGFHASNSSSAVMLTALSKVPARKWFEVLALINRYAPADSKEKGGKRT